MVTVSTYHRTLAGTSQLLGNEREALTAWLVFPAGMFCDLALIGSGSVGMEGLILHHPRSVSRLGRGM